MDQGKRVGVRVLACVCARACARSRRGALWVLQRKTAADKLYGRGTSDLPMPAASKVTFDDD